MTPGVGVGVIDNLMRIEPDNFNVNPGKFDTFVLYFYTIFYLRTSVSKTYGYLKILNTRYRSVCSSKSRVFDFSIFLLIFCLCLFDADDVLAVVDRLVVLGFYRKLQSKGSGSTALADAKRIQNVKKRCPPYKNAIHPLCTHCVRISYALPIKHPYTMISSA